MGSCCYRLLSATNMSAMSTALQPRCSARERAPAQSIAAELEYRRLQAADQALMRRLAREPLQYESASDSSDSEHEPEDDPASDDELEDQENIPPASAWQPCTHDIHPTPCTAHAAVVLPRRRDRTELGYFRCFLTNTLIDIMVTNTNAYAQSRQATPPFVTDAPEMWRFIAARIRMGIVQLPALHMYWQAEYEDRYLTQLFPRERFNRLLRYWHIAPPTPAGEKQRPYGLEDNHQDQASQDRIQVVHHRFRWLPVGLLKLPWPGRWRPPTSAHSSAGD